MLEIATVKTAVETLRAVLELVGKRPNRKRETFERYLLPLYDRMESIATEYHGALAEASRQLNKTDVELNAIIAQLQLRRDDLGIARQRVLGEVWAFMRAHEVKELSTLDPQDYDFPLHIMADFDTLRSRFKKRHQTLDLLITDFAISIFAFFWDANIDHSSTWATSILDELGDLREKHGSALGLIEYEQKLIETRERTRAVVAGLEAGWQGTTRAFTELRLYCHG